MPRSDDKLRPGQPPLKENAAGMDAAAIDAMILRFFRDDVGGVFISDAAGAPLYADDKAEGILREVAERWQKVCPPPASGQRCETWDLTIPGGKKSYAVTTSTYESDHGLVQLHFFSDNSAYMELFRDINGYTRALKSEKEHDGLTGLFNKGKFMELNRTLFPGRDSIAVYNMDVNDLKKVNDTQGHEAGDRLICKAAESLRAIEARNVLTFRVGGDEFMAIALHVSREQAENIRCKWQQALRKLNALDDGVPCVIACGMAYGENGYDLEALFTLADQRMYEDKQRIKQGMGTL